MEITKEIFMNSIFNSIVSIHFYLDVFMTDFISYNFVEDNNQKRREFIQHFLDKAPYSKKTSILRAIIKNKFPHLLEKDKQLIEKINKIGELRNDFAHSIIEFDLDFYKQNPGKILLKKFENGEIRDELKSYDEIFEDQKKASDVLKILSDEVIKMIKFSNTQEALLSLIGKSLTPPTE